jgi:predicted nucleic acid-binding protein
MTRPERPLAIGVADGLVDTNVFIHALATDEHTEECQRFLALLEGGALSARLEVAVLHELSYMLKRFQKLMTRDDIGAYLLGVLGWPGIEAD